MKQQSTKTTPNLIAKLKETHDDKATFVTIGAAWTKEDGSIYLKLHGTQIVNSPIYLFSANRE